MNSSQAGLYLWEFLSKSLSWRSFQFVFARHPKLIIDFVSILIIISPSKISRPREYYNFTSQTHGSCYPIRNSQRRLFLPTQSLDWDRHGFWLSSCVLGWILIFSLFLGLQSFEPWHHMEFLQFLAPCRPSLCFLSTNLALEFVLLKTEMNNLIGIVAVSVWKLSFWFSVLFSVIYWCIKAVPHFLTDLPHVLLLF